MELRLSHIWSYYLKFEFNKNVFAKSGKCPSHTIAYFNISYSSVYFECQYLVILTTKIFIKNITTVFFSNFLLKMKTKYNLDFCSFSLKQAFLFSFSYTYIKFSSRSLGKGEDHSSAKHCSWIWRNKKIWITHIA